MPDDKKVIVPLKVTEESIKNMICLIRGQRVMLDVDLAEIYGYETKNFNRQVKNNAARFEGEDFMFQLTDEEVVELSRCKNFTLNRGSGRGSNVKYKPHAFTEQGIYMLMTVLRGELAIRQSRALVIAFKTMKDYIIENRDILGAKEILQISVQTQKNTNDIAEIKEQMATKADLQKVMDNFIDPDTYKHFLILNGQKVEADAAYSKIYKSARSSIYVVDNYIGLKTLELFRTAKKNVQIIVFSDNLKNRTMLTATMFSDFQQEYADMNISFKQTCGLYHDRYIAIDYGETSEAVYHCGASSKDSGNKTTTICRIEDISVYKQVFDSLLKNPPLTI